MYIVLKSKSMRMTQSNLRESVISISAKLLTLWKINRGLHSRHGVCQNCTKLRLSLVAYLRHVQNIQTLHNYPSPQFRRRISFYLSSRSDMKLGDTQTFSHFELCNFSECSFGLHLLISCFCIEYAMISLSKTLKSDFNDVQVPTSNKYGSR